MYKVNKLIIHGWALAGIGVLFGAGGASAWAADDPAAHQTTTGAHGSTAGADEAAAAAQSEVPLCTGAGVTLTFDSGSTAINDRGRSSLNGVVKWLEQDEGRTVHVDGFADKTGNAVKNEALSEKRAEVAKVYLVSKGIEPARIEASGHGENAAGDPDLENTRAVAVTTCESPTVAMAEPPAAETPPAPAEAEAPPAVVVVPPAPAPQPSDNVTVNVLPAPVPAPEPEQPKDKPPSVIGVQATVGGGATGFVQDGARAFTDTGGSWDGRLSVGTRTPITFEGAYIGSAQGLSAFGLTDDTLLVGNGAEGAIRINFTTMRIQPYVFGGAGWINYQIRNGNLSTSDVTERDNVFEVPFGLGVSGRLGQGFIVDVRGTGRATFGDTLFNRAAAVTAVSGNTGMNSWNASANLGWEF